MKLAVIDQFKLVVLDEGKYFEIPSIPTLTQALELTLADLRKKLETESRKECTGKLSAPIAPELELWGAGVTYLRSRDARKEESGVPDVYQRVYESARPELFFKGNARRTRGDLMANEANGPSLANSYLDFAGLARLRSEAHRSSGAANREAAQQFEAMFIQMMMKSMREASFKGELLDSGALDTFQGLQDREISVDRKSVV